MADQQPEDAKKNEGDKLVQRVYERRLKGSRRSRRQTRHPSSSSGQRRGSRTSGRSNASTTSVTQRRHRDEKGQPPLQIFPPRPPETRVPTRVSGDEERPPAHLQRLPSPQIVVTPPPTGESESEPSKLAKLVRRLSKEHLKPPARKRRHKQRHKGKAPTSSEEESTTGKETPTSVKHKRKVKNTLAAALKDKNQPILSGQPIQLKLTKSHVALRSRHRHRKSRREKWTKEEIDWEWKELLWRMNIFGRIHSGFADIEYRIIRFGYKYEGILIPYFVIMLMFFLPFAIYWDYLAINHYEVPQFTFLRRVGCITLVHFLAVILNTYAYMKASLQNKRPRLRFLLGIGMFVHPALFFIRCYFDKTHDSYAAEKSIYYDSYTRKVDQDPPTQGYQGYADRFSNEILKFQPWDQFVEDRDHYYNLPLRD